MLIVRPCKYDRLQPASNLSPDLLLCVFLNKTACGVHELHFVSWLVGTASPSVPHLSLAVATGVLVPICMMLCSSTPNTLQSMCLRLLPCQSSCNACTMSSILIVWISDNSNTLSTQAWAQITKEEALGGQAAAPGQLHCCYPICCALPAVP